MQSAQSAKGDQDVLKMHRNRPTRSMSFPASSGQIHVLDKGFIYTADAASSQLTERAAAVWLVSLSNEPLTVTVGNKGIKSRSILVGPSVARRLFCQSIPFAAVHIDPSNPLHPLLSRRTKAVPLIEVENSEIQAIRSQLLCLQRTSEIELEQFRIISIFEKIEGALLESFGCDVEQDSRIRRALDMMDGQSPTDYSFAELLNEARMSPGRFSHLFTEQVGVSLRSFKLWRKVIYAIRLIANSNHLTGIAHDSGFADSAHMSRTFRACFGLMPSCLTESSNATICDHSSAPLPSDWTIAAA